MKKIQEKFNHYIMILVHAFTWQTLILSLTSQINSQSVIQFFIVALTITGLMAITDIFTLKRSLPVLIIVDLIDITAVVFGMGGCVFKWFPFEWLTLLSIIGFIVIIYFIIFGFIMLQMKKDSEHINKIIKQQLNKESNNDE